MDIDRRASAAWNKIECTRCGVAKNHGQFTVSRNGVRHSWCRACCAERKRLDRSTPEGMQKAREANRRSRRRGAHTEARSKYSAAEYATPEGRARSLHSSARQRARIKGESFNLSLSKVMNAVRAGVCERTGLPFELVSGYVFSTGKQSNPRAPSIDKIDPRQPYSDANVQIVCNWYNRAKGELSDAEHIELCRHAISHEEQGSA